MIYTVIMAFNRVFPVCPFESLKSPERSYASNSARQATSGGVAPKKSKWAKKLISALLCISCFLFALNNVLDVGTKLSKHECTSASVQMQNRLHAIALSVCCHVCQTCTDLQGKKPSNNPTNQTYVGKRLRHLSWQVEISGVCSRVVHGM